MSELKEKNKILNRTNLGLNTNFPIKVVQFGEGNFLRAFVDFAFQRLNQEADFNAGIAVVQPIDRGLVDLLNKQEGLYTVFMNGIKKGKEIQDIELITNVIKGIDPYKEFKVFLDLAKEESLQFIISNTTEAGIAYIDTDTLEMEPPNSFPAKLAVLLYERFKYFNGQSEKGLTIIPCELINHNSDKLKEIILKYCKEWNLEKAFVDWVLNHCSFHNTLVDRIVPGYPKDEIEDYNSLLDYEDNLIVTAETFFLWVIEGDMKLQQKLPFHKTDLDVRIVKDMQPYRTRKVRILNGAHTSLVALSILHGNTTVKQTIDNDFTGEFVNKTIFEEIIDVVAMDKQELKSFAEEVLDRFRNPFIKHQLSDLALNCISKFKVRVLPSLLEYESIHHKLPTHLTFSLACLIRFYKGTWNNSTLPLKDSQDIIETFSKIWTLNDYHTIAETALKEENFWEQDLTKLKGLADAIALALEEIELNGVEKGFANFSKKL